MPATRTVPAFETLDDLLDSLGGISPKRVRMKPPPGRATENDVIRIRERERRLFELVDGTLVEKVMGAPESSVAGVLMQVLRNHSDAHGGLGVALGESGMLKLLGGLVRIPDICFILRSRLPNGKLPHDPVPDLVPDLAVEVLSRGNTRREMERKLKEYFLAGVRLVWFIDPRSRTARVFTSPDDSTELGPAGTLDGGDVLPGFRVRVARLFAELEDPPTPKTPKGKKK